MPEDDNTSEAKKAIEAALKKAMKDEAEQAKITPGLARILRHTHWKVKKDRRKK